jgi:hypothetical protein
VRDVLEVAADLVTPACLRHGIDQRDAGVRVAVHRHIKLPGAHTAQVRDCRLSCGVRWCVVQAQRVIDAAGGLGPAACVFQPIVDGISG